MHQRPQRACRELFDLTGSSAAKSFVIPMLVIRERILAARPSPQQVPQHVQVEEEEDLEDAVSSTVLECLAQKVSPPQECGPGSGFTESGCLETPIFFHETTYDLIRDCFRCCVQDRLKNVPAVVKRMDFWEKELHKPMTTHRR
jgi:hypothetical protein